MRTQVYCAVLAVLSLAVGCGGGGSGSSTQTPTTQTPTVASWTKVASTSVAYSGSVLSNNVIERSDGLMFVFGGPTPNDPMHTCATQSFKAVLAKADRTLTAVDNLLPVVNAVHAREMVVADFNGDAVPDVFSANHGCDGEPFPGERNTLLLSSGVQYVNANANLPNLSSFTHATDAADLGRGKTDIVVLVTGTLGDAQVGSYILRGNGDGTFVRDTAALPSKITERTMSAPAYTSVKLADVDRDGFVDLILGGMNFPNVVYLNDKAGSFNTSEIVLPAALYGANTSTVDIQVLNDSGKQYLLLSQTPNYAGARVQVLESHGDGTFSDVTSTMIPNQPQSQMWYQFLHVIDLNNDGCKDILIQTDRADSNYVDDVRAFQNSCNGTFSVMDSSKVPDGSLIPGKLNGKDVLISTTRTSNQITVSLYAYQ